MRVLFTGGSGKAGKHVVTYLAARGHRVMNVDRVPLNHAGVHDLLADITDSGQMFNAMQTYAGFDEMEAGTGAKACCRTGKSARFGASGRNTTGGAMSWTRTPDPRPVPPSAVPTSS